MLRRAVWIWSMHSLAFVAGLVVSGVVTVGLLSLVPATGPTWLQLGLALATSIVSAGAGYGLYLTIVSLLLDVELGWSFYLMGPVVVLGIMAMVFAAVFWGIAPAGVGVVAGYVALFLAGGGALMLRQPEDQARAEDLRAWDEDAQ